jgi:hypothetical protein
MKGNMQNYQQASQDKLALREINEKIGAAESKGDREWFISILAPRLAFQRADKMLTVDDQNSFLWKVKEAPSRTTDIIEPIQLFGNRAVVQCIVKMGGQEFHNLRLFVKRNDEWKLLGWANEQA